MKLCPLFLLLSFILKAFLLGFKKPNVLLIVCDDLNDYIETMGGTLKVKLLTLKS